MAIREQQDIKVLFWGMAGEFSTLVLERLINGGMNIRAVVTHAAIISREMDPISRLHPDPPRSQLPLSSPYLQRSITQLAWQNQLPVFEVRHLSSPAAADQLAAVEADVAIVACFPRRIPQHILTVPKHGFLNLHPSLLPDLRGPFPLFYSFRLGQQRTGVTVHHMDAGLDSGDIALQQPLSLPDGISGPQADSLLAAHGASLLLKACRQLGDGRLPRIVQPDGGSRYARPIIEDFHIPTTWSARHAYNFICGTAEWRIPYHITGPGSDLTLRHAVSFDAFAEQQEAVLRDGRDQWIQFTPGVLHAR